MNRAAFFLRVLLLVALAGVALAPATASAGTYVVKACGDGPQADSWTTESSPYVVSFGFCPAANTEGGLGSRVIGDAQPAPSSASGRTFFTAPAGTNVVRFQGDIRVHQDRGWHAGIYDWSNRRWVYCGFLSSCTTFGTFQTIDIGGFSSASIGTLVICASSTSCPRDRSYGYSALKNVTFTIADDTAPGVEITGGGLVDGGWRRGRQGVNFNAGDSTGIKATRLLVDGAQRAGQGRPCDVYRASPCPNGGGTLEVDTSTLEDGRHAVAVEVVDAGDNVGRQERVVQIDNTPPGQMLDLELSGGEGWRSDNRFAFTWANPEQGDVAPVSGVEYEMCPAGVASGGAECRRGRRDGRDLTKLEGISVPGRGEWTLRAWLRDEAGNESISTAAAPVRLRFDDQAPELAFRPSDPADPATLVAAANDAPAGIAAGEIEVQRRGDAIWRSLETTVSGDGLSAVVDDETLPEGAYLLRARAVDRAGNERSTSALLDGRAAEVTLPIRVKTRLAAGQAKRVRVKRRGRGARRYRTKLVTRPGTAYGRKVRLSGRLTTPGQNPIAGTVIEVAERLSIPQVGYRAIGTVTTSKTGRFQFRAPPGPSRTLRFRYAGTKTIRGGNADVELRVRASTSMRSNHRSVANGEAVTFRGRLKGGHIPAKGKLVALQVYSRGRWRTFATPRADASSGLWRYDYRFDGTRGRVRYRFRARVLQESGYPFSSGTSRSVPVLVRGTRR